ncbi:MAG TPA: S-layer homology domain-containing protein [Anaerolineales bacterium]
MSFTDVHPSDYFYVPVIYLACHGVISGYNDAAHCGTNIPCFAPFNNTTRAQMVKIVVLGFNIPIVTPTPTGSYTFTDVQPGHPFYSWIETAAADNIVTGYPCGGPGEPCDPQNRPYFRPNAFVTRGQLSKIDVIAAGWPQINPVNNTFQDVLPTNPFYTYIETAACHGIINGYPCGGVGEPCVPPDNKPYFRWFNNATRGQIAKIVYLSITNPPACESTPTPAVPKGRP